MIEHVQLGSDSFATSRQLKRLIDDGVILIAGNKKLKIFGKLNCRSGKRMKRVNRVFFSSEAEAIAEGFRPCAHCLRNQYLQWKANTV